MEGKLIFDWKGVAFMSLIPLGLFALAVAALDQLSKFLVLSMSPDILKGSSLIDDT